MSYSLNRFLLFFGLAANVAFVYFPTVAFANILWSVAVEEQFYLFWPHVVKFKRKLLWIILFVHRKFEVSLRGTDNSAQCPH
jgi:peptidoglycan/LPS O-acetylase OafA/YrhL